jgi:uncharacterized SAM-binding protein YcdF (DUF218 family)
MIPRFIKWATLGVVAVVLILVLYWTYLYREIRSWAIRDEAHKAEAIVVLGAAQYNGHPSPVLKARLDHAYELYRQGYAPAIITTGSYGPDPNFSEAQVSTRYLVQRGVDMSDIITEQGSGTTYDSIQAASELLKAKGWTTALVVSDGFHLYRAKRMFSDNGITTYTSPAPNSPIEIESSQRFWHSLREVMLFSAYRWLRV